jgi:V-type H+-transporting ATPase 16kDa proteolipid subunit
MGASMAMVLSSLGAAYGIAKSGIGISAVSILRPDMMVRSKQLPFSRLPSQNLTISNQI